MDEEIGYSKDYPVFFLNFLSILICDFITFIIPNL